MRTTATRRKAPDQPEPVEFWDRFTVLAYFGGDRPLHRQHVVQGRPARHLSEAGERLRQLRALGCQASVTPLHSAWSLRVTSRSRSSRGRRRRRISPSLDQFIGAAASAGSTPVPVFRAIRG